MNKLKLSSFFIALIVMMSMAMLTACDKNEDIGGEVWDYPWYVDPDTGRCEDGKLYFSPRRESYEGCGFLTNISGIEVRKQQTKYGECHGITALGGSGWEVTFSFTGEKVTADTNFIAFKELCRQTGFRPGIKTPYDPDLLKLQPIYDWGDSGDLCCVGIKNIKIINQKEFKSYYPSSFNVGDDLSNRSTISTVYMDDSFEWHRTHKDQKPVIHNFFPNANYNITGTFPVFMFNEAPQLRLINRFSIHFKHCVPSEGAGDYSVKLIILLTNGEEFSADLLLKAY